MKFKYQQQVYLNNKLKVLDLNGYLGVVCGYSYNEEKLVLKVINSYTAIKQDSCYILKGYINDELSLYSIDKIEHQLNKTKIY